METTTLAQTQVPFSFSESAIREIRRLKEQKNQKPFLRLGARSGGCTGLSYVLEFDNKEEKDLHYEAEGIQVIINPAHIIYVKDMLINWSGGLNARGFTFENPNAKETCGCGTSFAV